MSFAMGHEPLRVDMSEHACNVPYTPSNVGRSRPAITSLSEEFLDSLNTKPTRTTRTFHAHTSSSYLTPTPPGASNGHVCVLASWALPASPAPLLWANTTMPLTPAASNYFQSKVPTLACRLTVPHDST